MSALLTVQAGRLVRIEKMLSHGRAVNMAQFQCALRVSVPTFKRDLDTLCSEFGAPITWDRFARGYRLTAPWSGVAKVLAEQLEAM